MACRCWEINCSPRYLLMHQWNSDDEVIHGIKELTNVSCHRDRRWPSSGSHSTIRKKLGSRWQQTGNSVILSHPKEGGGRWNWYKLVMRTWTLNHRSRVDLNETTSSQESRWLGVGPYSNGTWSFPKIIFSWRWSGQNPFPKDNNIHFKQKPESVLWPSNW